LKLRPTTAELLEATVKVIPRALTVDFVVRTQNSVDDYLGYLGRTRLEADGYQLRTTLSRYTQASYYSLSRIGLLRQWQVRDRWIPKGLVDNSR